MPRNNDGAHIQRIIDETTCNKHSSNLGDSCWYIYHINSRVLARGVCGSRIRKAGYNGEISPDSMALGSRSRSASSGKRSNKASDRLTK